MESYGTPEPPEVDLSKVRVPYAMFMGDHDEFSSVADNLEVLERMSGVQRVHCRVLEGMGHILMGEGINV